MRRVLASLLLVLWVAGCCGPLLSAASRLPACCRLNGNHHCTRVARDGFQSAAASCPYQHGTALASQPNTALAGSAQPAFLSIVQSLPLGPQSCSAARQPVANVSGRGPPLLLT